MQASTLSLNIERIRESDPGGDPGQEEAGDLSELQLRSQNLLPVFRVRKAVNMRPRTLLSPRSHSRRKVSTVPMFACSSSGVDILSALRFVFTA
ncbi:hypothetical protein PBY51_024795 [Eleginops maclovinus]|uniref:Uncharacterized protein n=1 Tax=Eleginops maclovinus TaxID=56733 RepID=A0AAN7Y066_ELEMC|nr:hypothetical protein PBY51_024795 [Eleginops maclovinus]